MPMSSGRSRYNDRSSSRLAVGVAVAAVAGAVFWRTAYPTINWWDSASYSLASRTLGLTSSPGSLLLTLIGWFVTRMTSGLTTARVLSLTGAAIAVAAIWLVYVGSLRLRRLAEPGEGVALPAYVGAALGALTFAFTSTFWEYATQFTPYILSAAFTALIVVALLHWWRVADEPHAWRSLALVTLLFGLDFSVHRTNAMLLPGAIAWVILRKPRTLLHPPSWLAALGGMILGLSVQVLVMPIARVTDSPINMAEPTTWGRLWSYVSLAQVGGGFLIELWPRNAPFWSYQVVDFLKTLGDNFFTMNGPFGPVGLVAGLAALVALVALWRENRRLGIALVTLIVLHSLTTVLYFNIRESYFRSLYRHYLPVFVVSAVVASCGMSMMANHVAVIVRRRRPARSLGVAGVGALVLVLAPVAQLTRNWNASDASRTYFAHDYAVNALKFLPQNAIYVTVGDNDTFPIWYVQTVEGVRPDVIVVNLSLANADWYIRQLARRYPSFPVRDMPAKERDKSVTVVIPVTSAEQVGLPAGTVMLDSLRVRPAPRYGTDMIASDWILLDLVRDNAWKRPLAVSTTAGENNLGWLKPYVRLEGLYWRIVPAEHPSPDTDVIRSNLRERYEIRGYADTSLPLEQTSKSIGGLYLIALNALLDADRASGDVRRCNEDRAAVRAKVPPERIGSSFADIDAIRRRCQP